MRIKDLTAFLLFTLFASTADAQMRIVKTNYSSYVNGALNPLWYIDYAYDNPQQLYYSEMSWFAKDSVGAYNNNSKTTYTRDSKGNVTESISVRWDGIQWINQSKQNYLYDSFGNTTFYAAFAWEFGNWKEEIRDTRVYSSYNQLIQEVRMQGFQTPLTNQSKQDYEYDVDGRLINHYRYSWDDVNNVWYVPSKRVYLYKGTSSVIDSSYLYGWSSSQNSYQLFERYLYNYNASNQLITILVQRNPNQQWENLKKDEYQYHSSGRIAKHEQYNWNNNAWILIDGKEEDFDSQGRIILKIRKAYDANLQQAVNNLKTIYTYASDSSVITTKYENWSNGLWINNSLNEDIYETVQQTSTSVKKLATINAKVYPNPFSVNTIIEFESKHAGQANIQIADNTGRIVFEEKQNIQSGINSILWNAIDDKGNSLPSGAYFFILKAKDILIANKLMKL
jgi:hypothetical protein